MKNVLNVVCLLKKEILISVASVAYIVQFKYIFVEKFV